MSSSYPPPPSDPAYPHVPPATPGGLPAPHAQGHPGAPAQYWQPPVGYLPPRQGNGLAIAAVVMSGLALLGVLGIGLFMGVGMATAPSLVLQGDVTPTGTTVAGTELESALTTAVEDDGGQVDEISCPDTSAVGQGLVTVCHGSVDGFDWTGVVVFEDETGTFIVTPL